MKIIFGLMVFLLNLTANAKTLHFYLQDFPGSLDWNGLTTHVEAPLLDLLEEGLFEYEFPSGKCVPGIAQSLTKSKDLRTYTFILRPEARWSDGVDVRAQDFIDSWLRLASPQSTSLYNFYLDEIDGMPEYRKGSKGPETVGLSAPSARTLVVRLKRPLPQWEAVTAFWPLYAIRKDLLEKHGPSVWKAGTLPSDGPYELVSAIPGKTLVMKRNPHYTRLVSNVDEIQFEFSTDFDEALKKYDSGYYPFLSPLPLARVKALSSRKDFQSRPMLRNYVLVANTEHFPMGNRLFRKALSHAVELNDLQEFSQSMYRVSKGMVHQSIAHYPKARRTSKDLKQALVDLKDSGVVVTPALKIKLLTRIQDPFAQIANQVKKQIEAALKVNVEVSARHQGDFNAYAALHDYDLALVSWSAKVPVPEDFLAPYSSAATNSRLIYKSPFFDQWLDTALKKSDSTQKWEAIQQAEEVYLDNEYVVHPVLDEWAGYLLHPDVRGFYLNHLGVAHLRNLMLP